MLAEEARRGKYPGSGYGNSGGSPTVSEGADVARDALPHALASAFFVKSGIVIASFMLEPHQFVLNALEYGAVVRDHDYGARTDVWRACSLNEQSMEVLKMNWQENLIGNSQGIRDLLARTKRIAVLGMRTETHAFKPAFYVPQYLVSAGLEVIPVPVHHPEATTILGQKVYHKLTDIPGEIDLVNVFRRPADIDGHLEDILAKMPAAVWFQSGIRNDEAAEKLAKAGIKVVQDRCLMIDHRQFGQN